MSSPNRDRQTDPFPPVSEGPDRPLRLYRLVPVAAPDDPNWDSAPNHGEVLVRAYSAADARIVAAEAELDFTEIDAKPAEGTDTRMALPGDRSRRRCRDGRRRRARGRSRTGSGRHDQAHTAVSDCFETVRFLVIIRRKQVSSAGSAAHSACLAGGFLQKDG